MALHRVSCVAKKINRINQLYGLISCINWHGICILYYIRKCRLESLDLLAYILRK